MDVVYHYPPELMNLLIDTIPLLCRSKTGLLLFFRGAGVSQNTIADLVGQVHEDRESITKYEIARTVLTRVNEGGDQTLAQRREILKRVTEFEDFSTCWPEDQLKAKGLVSEVRRVVNVKDSFTRMKLEREAERKKRQAEQQERLHALQRRRDAFAAIKDDLFALFREKDAHRRGKSLEGVLNRLFETSGISVRESFTLREPGDGKALEEIDGVITISGELYLVEMKWWSDPLGPGEVSQHLVRVFVRGCARGICISASGYTHAALATCKESLSKMVFVLCKLEEIVKLLEQEADLEDFLKQKIEAAVIHKNPLFEPLG